MYIVYHFYVFAYQSANGRQQLGAGPLPTNPTSPLPKNRFSLSSTDSESKSASFRSSPQTLTPASVSIDESSEGESCHTFGVPLALCPPSSKSRVGYGCTFCCIVRQ